MLRVSQRTPPTLRGGHDGTDQAVDRTLFRWINDLVPRTTWANDAVNLYAKAGIVLFAVLLAIAYLDGRHHDDRGALAGAVWAAIAALVALGLAQVIGGAVDRARPYTTLANVHLLASRTTDFSFPSDHCTVAGAVAAGLLLVGRHAGRRPGHRWTGRWGRIAAVAALLMALARVYVGVHYPGDVVAGLALGALVAVVGYHVVVPSLRHVGDRLAATALRPLLTSMPLAP